MKVYLEFDSDDDFIFSIGNEEGVSYTSFISRSKEEAIKLLKSFKIIKSFDWNQSGNTFTRSTNSNPTDHWFQKEIDKAIKNLEEDKDTSIRGNQTLVVEIH